MRCLRRRVAIAMLVAAAALLAPPDGLARPIGSGADERAVVVGGIERSYLLYVPAGVQWPAPVVMVFHGGGGRAQAIMQTTGMNEVADQHRFVAVYPQGLGPQGLGSGPRGTWNIGGPDSPSEADDVSFVRAILADLAREYRLDRRRIYAAGESMGGVFAYRLACEMSDTFAAIAPVAATMVSTGCVPTSPVAVFHVHGSNDENIPLTGGAGMMTARGRSWPPVESGIQRWVAFDRCAGPRTSRQDGPETTCYSYGRCQAPVEYCVIMGGGHAWPGSVPRRWQQAFSVHVSQTFPTSARIWAFFAAQPKA